MPRTTRMTLAYEAGIKAYKDGKLLSDNPYQQIGPGQDNWDKGYRDAERESKDQNNKFTSTEKL